MFPSEPAPGTRFGHYTSPNVPSSNNTTEPRCLPPVGSSFLRVGRSREIHHLDLSGANDVSSDTANALDFNHLACSELAQSHSPLYDIETNLLSQLPVILPIPPVGDDSISPIEDGMEMVPPSLDGSMFMNVRQQQNLFLSMSEDQEYSPEIRRSFSDPTYRRSTSLPVYFPSLFAQADGMELQAYGSSSGNISPLCRLDLDPAHENNDVDPGDQLNLADTRNLEDPDRTNTRYQGHSFYHPTDYFSHTSCFENQHETTIEGLRGSWVPYRTQTYPAGQLATSPSMKVSEPRPQSPSCFTQIVPFPQACMLVRNSPKSYQTQQLGNAALGQRMPDSGYTTYPTDQIPDPSGTSANPNGHFSCTGYPKVLRARCERDDFLLRSKSVGMSYREIKAKGRFKEAESTLRGRFRTLTKSKDQRVRKPQWQDHDIQLLRKAVEQYSSIQTQHPEAQSNGSSAGEASRSSKIPWKRVAEHVARHGSYHFGNATCRKKWDEINGLVVPSTADSI